MMTDGFKVTFMSLSIHDEYFPQMSFIQERLSVNQLKFKLICSLKSLYLSPSSNFVFQCAFIIYFLLALHPQVFLKEQVKKCTVPQQVSLDKEEVLPKQTYLTMLRLDNHQDQTELRNAWSFSHNLCKPSLTTHMTSHTFILG